MYLCNRCGRELGEPGSPGILSAFGVQIEPVDPKIRTVHLAIHVCPECRDLLLQWLNLDSEALP
jgi:hypothetical protein